MKFNNELNSYFYFYRKCYFGNEKCKLMKALSQKKPDISNFRWWDYAAVVSSQVNKNYFDSYVIVVWDC